MGIWIRSQDKEILVECNAVVVNPIDNSDYCIYAYCKNDRVYLGYYSTREKALKVLDEIEKSLIGTITVENIELNKLEILKEELKQKRTISTAPVENLGVFQMPQDDEV